MDVSRVLATIGVALALLAASAGKASAADAEITGGTLRYLPGLGEANDLVISRTGDTWHLFDPGSDSIAPGSGCVPVGLFAADCTDPAVQSVLVQLGDLDDRLTIDDIAYPPGGIRAEGGTGADALTGGPGPDLLLGEAGNDVLAGSSGNDILDGGDGADVLAGSGGFDTATYADRSAPVGVSLDDLPGDGEAGEGDNVIADTDRVVGGSGPDTLVGNAAANALEGGPGDDVLDGGTGPDALSGGDGVDTVSYAGRTAGVTVRLDGLPGDGVAGEGDNVDVEDVLGGAGDDTLIGNGAANVLVGGGGDDQLVGAGSPDRLLAGAGQDVVDARDGAADSAVDCDGGLDFAASDPADAPVACEEADRGGARKPTVRRNALVREVSGSVTIRFPAATRFVPLDGTLEIPLGSEIDATDGFVRLTTARNRRGDTQAATFYEGRFFVRQGSGPEPVTELKLSGGDFSTCARRRTAADGSPSRHLWGREGGRRGKYRTRGRWSSGAVRGTTWLTRDTCAGTLTRVTKGRVVVSDLVRKRSVVVRAGHQYLARARG